MNNIRRIPTYISNGRLIKKIKFKKACTEICCKELLINEKVTTRFKNLMHEKLEWAL